jgi:hypothetical protein
MFKDWKHNFGLSTGVKNDILSIKKEEARRQIT